MVQQCGVDGHFTDPLGHLSLTTDVYDVMTSTMHDLVHEYCDGKWILVGGGGYNLASVSRCWTTIFSQLSEVNVQNTLPSSWRTVFKQITGTEAPTTLYDRSIPNVSINTREMVSRTVQNTINHVKKNIAQHPPK